MYAVIEHQIKPDGTVNMSETARSTFAMAESYYHERYSKMRVNTEFVSVSIMLVDENLNVIQQAIVETCYQPLVEETEEQTEERVE